ncbi:uncharacterized protein LOC127376842 isoform X2 [Dicentrarchus labrax]|uniref:uncharacterized protein LOC127376842 isoform X2 n=1 Tax=Dicentrarchus labrax TaxID=13489 RepID=UPI0021F56936|nr:uncharacterized protein LOC127376842 isoform X2 [Dicentrarchus labrax]
MFDSKTKMAAPIFHVFLNHSMVAFVDKDRTVPYQGNLYQNAERYFVDEGLMVAVDLHLADCTCTDTCNVQVTASLPVNECFNKEQTLFLIHLMGIHLEVEGEGPAKSLNDLNRRLRLRKKTKTLLWEEMAGKLGRQFREQFQPKKVARKWLTLVEGYKKCKDNNASTGRGPVRFQFYTEMDELIGGNHDVDPPVVGSDRAGVVIRRPDALRQSSSAPSPVSADWDPSSSPCNSKLSALPTRAPSPVQSTSSSSPSPASPSASRTPTREPATPSSTPRSQKHQRREDDLLAHFARSEAAALMRHKVYVAEMRETRSVLIQLLSRTRSEAGQ